MIVFVNWTLPPTELVEVYRPEPAKPDRAYFHVAPVRGNDPKGLRSRGNAIRRARRRRKPGRMP